MVAVRCGKAIGGSHSSLSWSVCHLLDGERVTTSFFVIVSSQQKRLHHTEQITAACNWRAGMGRDRTQRCSYICSRLLREVFVAA
ncbi:hypothetical protein JTE90_007475 [Oedothorax gibbosus]|uniref:Uncharacterized protein n=1 Tax=Oedothorax gibbosus TaxID=931172 RepID=A0AAV6U7H3_9ARAC|nr:hypothetical protein JTE90_007475 [Oedothorax gibbosus]